MDWIDEGLAALAQEGLPAVRIDRIVARLGVSKGSFHHHFAGAGAWREAVTRRYRERMLAALSALDVGEGLALLELLSGLAPSVSSVLG